MDITELDIGTRLELEVYNENGSKLDYTLASEFEWITEDNCAVIAAPIHEGVLYPLRIGASINVNFAVRQDNDIKIYSFAARIIARDNTDNLALLKVSIESELRKVQRRRFYRLECSLQVKYRIVDSMNPAKNADIPYKHTLASNLSGGGICLLMEDKNELGRIIECEIDTGEKSITFFGRIVRYEKNEVNSKYRYEAGIVYVKIDEKDREAVVGYIFSQQRILRKKGLI